MQTFRTWKCDISRKIEDIKKRLSFQDNGTDLRAKVLSVIEDVKKHGDKAIINYSKRFDHVTLSPGDFRVKDEEIENAYREIPLPFIKSIQLSITNVKRYQEHIRIRDVSPLRSDGTVLDTLYIPIDKAGIYVPGGTASYPSTVIMNTVPAVVAGVGKIIMTTPPARDGTIPPERLVAAKEAGVHEIYKIGGAHAIAALSFGTKTIPKVDKIVGPGNIFVTLAKKEIFGYSGIDMLAGPSEVLIIADDTANPAFVAADLLSQAEHAPGIAILVTFSESLVKRILAELKQQLARLNRRTDTKRYLDEFGIIIITRNIEECTDIANALAPEHLQIITRKPKNVLSGIKHAGAIFVGPYSPVAIGDYIAGPSHVLPTGGTARFSSGLSVNDFLKRSCVITYSKAALKNVYHDIEEISEAEGLDAHARSIQLRIFPQKVKPLNRKKTKE